jgi:hypothetical protein
MCKNGLAWAVTHSQWRSARQQQGSFSPQGAVSVVQSWSEVVAVKEEETHTFLRSYPMGF